MRLVATLGTVILALPGGLFAQPAGARVGVGPLNPDGDHR